MRSRLNCWADRSAPPLPQLLPTPAAALHSARRSGAWTAQLLGEGTFNRKLAFQQCTTAPRTLSCAAGGCKGDGGGRWAGGRGRQAAAMAA